MACAGWRCAVSRPTWTDSRQIGIGAIVAVVVGLLLSLIISARRRIIVRSVMVGIGAVIWQQRAAIEATVKKCQLDMTFMGIHVHAPADVQAQCKKRHSLTGPRRRDWK